MNSLLKSISIPKISEKYDYILFGKLLKKRCGTKTWSPRTGRNFRPNGPEIRPSRKKRNSKGKGKDKLGPKVKPDKKKIERARRLGWAWLGAVHPFFLFFSFSFSVSIIWTHFWNQFSFQIFQKKYEYIIFGKLVINQTFWYFYNLKQNNEIQNIHIDIFGTFMPISIWF